VGAVASEWVRQGQVPIMRIIGKGGFSKNNGEIGAPIIFALRNRLACPTLDIFDVKGCRTPEQLPQAFGLTLNGRSPKADVL